MENAPIALKFAPIVKWYQNFRLLTKNIATLLGGDFFAGVSGENLVRPSCDGQA